MVNYFYQKGYIVLTSVIIISLILVTMTSALALVNYYSRFGVLEGEYKKRSFALADSCIDYALSRLITTSPYVGEECLNIGESKCKVAGVTTGNYPKTILGQGVYQKSYTNLQVEVNSDFSIISWKELPQIITAACS